MEHVVTFEARANHGMGAYGPAAALVARCACGWTYTVVPREGREALILRFGLRHVSEKLAAQGGASVAAGAGRARA